MKKAWAVVAVVMPGAAAARGVALPRCEPLHTARPRPRRAGRRGAGTLRPLTGIPVLRSGLAAPFASLLIARTGLHRDRLAGHRGGGRCLGWLDRPPAGHPGGGGADGRRRDAR